MKSLKKIFIAFSIAVTISATSVATYACAETIIITGVVCHLISGTPNGDTCVWDCSKKGDAEIIE
jgi:hypothetical protein